MVADKASLRGLSDLSRASVAPPSNASRKDSTLTRPLLLCLAMARITAHHRTMGVIKRGEVGEVKLWLRSGLGEVRVRWELK